jgi:type IV secretory pathway VirJ component
MILETTPLPLQIKPGNCVVWIDYTNTNTLTLVAGSKISIAQDMSGIYNNAVQSTDSQRPVLTANAINGQQAALFTAANSCIMTIAGNSSLDITASLTMYAVYKALSNPAANAAPFYKDVTGSGGNAPYGLDRVSTGASGTQFTNTTPTTVTPGIAGNNVNTNIIHEAYYDGTNVSVKTNTSAENTSALASPLTTTPAGALNIGCQKVGVSRYFDGYIAEVILFNALLDSNQRLAMRQYLGRKYGITVT